MTRNYLVIAAAVALSSGAYAQIPSDHNPAVKDPAVHTMTAAAPGRNSFTESQAQGRIAKAGYTGVSKLTKDANGVWQGKAMKDGKAVSVSLDYKGDLAVR
jgi:hypothetical protein